VGAARFSPDGERVLTASGAMTTAWAGESGAVTSVASTSDGRLVAVVRVRMRVSIYVCEVCGPLPDLQALASQRVTRSLTADERHICTRGVDGWNPFLGGRTACRGPAFRRRCWELLGGKHRLVVERRIDQAPLPAL